MKIKEDVGSSLKEIVTYKAIPDKFVIKFFDNLNDELTDSDFPYIESLLFQKNYEIQLSIINYIKRSSNPRVAVVLVKLLNNPEIKFFIKMEALLALSKLDKDKKAQSLINKMIERLSVNNAGSESANVCKHLSTEKILEICREVLKEFLALDCSLSNTELSLKQIKQFISKEKLSVAVNIENNFDGCLIMNLSESSAATLIEHLYSTGFINLERVELDDYGIFNNLYIFFEKFTERLKHRFSLEDVNIEILNSNSFSYTELILSEKEDNAFLFEIKTNNFRFNIGFIIYVDDSVRMREFNDVLKNLNIELLSENNGIFKLECKATKVSIEYSGIQKNFQKVTGNRILLDAEKFCMIKNFYYFMLNEIQIDKSITARFSALVDFLVKICDNTSVNVRNYILFKLNQINPFFSRTIFSRMTFEHEILKYDEQTARAIINKMSDNELALIIFHTDDNIEEYIYANSSNNRIQSIKNCLYTINSKTIHKARIKKALDKFIELIKEHRETEAVYINRITDTIDKLCNIK